MAVCYVSMNWSAVLLEQGQHKMRGVPFWGEGTIGDLCEESCCSPGNNDCLLEQLPSDSVQQACH